MPEMLDDGVEGFLFAPGDAATAIRAMHAVSSDPSLRSRMAEAGRRRFSRQGGHVDRHTSCLSYRTSTIFLIHACLLPA